MDAQDLLESVLSSSNGANEARGCDLWLRLSMAPNPEMLTGVQTFLVGPRIPISVAVTETPKLFLSR